MAEQKADRPEWIPTDKELHDIGIYWANANIRAAGMLYARKLMEAICKRGHYMELDNSAVAYPIIALAPEFLQQLKQEVGLE